MLAGLVKYLTWGPGRIGKSTPTASRGMDVAACKTGNSWYPFAPCCTTATLASHCQTICSIGVAHTILRDLR
jgi:hypothetical protein